MWWLRTPGYTTDMTSFIHFNGIFNDNGDIVNVRDFAGVRPAFWVSIE